MRKTASVLLVVLMLLSLSAIAEATSYSFTPSPSGDLWDLDHNKYYKWGINWSIPANETIVGATLVFNDIYNWNNEPNDLYVHLLNNATAGVKQGTDNQGGGDYFNEKGILLNHWENLTTTPIDINYVFDVIEFATLVAYLANGNFGLGFDPDCHYFNSGISLNIITTAVPEPSTLLLISAGLLTLVGVRKLRKNT
jgi:hypothetical protein